MTQTLSKNPINKNILANYYRQGLFSKSELSNSAKVVTIAGIGTYSKEEVKKALKEFLEEESRIKSLKLLEELNKRNIKIKKKNFCEKIEKLIEYNTMKRVTTVEDLISIAFGLGYIEYGNFQ